MPNSNGKGSDEHKIQFGSLTLGPNAKSVNIEEIQLIGVIADKNGQPSQETIGFLDSSIVYPIFSHSSRIKGLEWKSLKIWLHDSTGQIDYRFYPEQVPSVNNIDLIIKSRNPISTLRAIYILDNHLEGSEYKFWRQSAETIFQELFQHFVAPPDLTKVKRSLFSGPLKRLVEKDRFANIKRDLHFDTLIIQVD